MLILSGKSFCSISLKKKKKKKKSLEKIDIKFICEEFISSSHIEGTDFPNSLSSSAFVASRSKPHPVSTQSWCKFLLVS